MTIALYAVAGMLFAWPLYLLYQIGTDRVGDHLATAYATLISGSFLASAAFLALAHWW